MPPSHGFRGLDAIKPVAKKWLQKGASAPAGWAARKAQTRPWQWPGWRGQELPGQTVQAIWSSKPSTPFFCMFAFPAMNQGSIYFICQCGTDFSDIGRKIFFIQFAERIKGNGKPSSRQRYRIKRIMGNQTSNPYIFCCNMSKNRVFIPALRNRACTHAKLGISILRKLDIQNIHHISPEPLESPEWIKLLQLLFFFPL